MARFAELLHILALIGIIRSQTIDIQAALNSFCTQFPNSAGCQNTSGSTNRLPQTGGGGRGGGCSTESRVCPELPGFCVPKDIECSVIGFGQQCQVPSDFGLGHQVLLCGDGTPAGVRCGDGVMVPVLSHLLLQCQGPYLSHTVPITELGKVTGPGGEGGGAGVYRCGTTGSWEPLYGSPFLNQLTLSCSKSGCGRLLQPSEKQPVHREWSWVRALYYNGSTHCTATLLSPSAALTAAHCLTRSSVSRITLDPSSFMIDLPGPNSLHKRIVIRVVSVHLHPRYTPQRGQQHDTAVVRFRPPKDYNLPTVCLNDQPSLTSRGEQVVFGLQHGFTDTSDEEPVWVSASARPDVSCRAVGTRSGGGVDCSKDLVVQPFQFCASHPGLSLTQGSSGGPYLVEVGTGVEEVWMLSGVLSYSSTRSFCPLTHSIYNHVAEDTNWIRLCVFDDQCN